MHLRLEAHHAPRAPRGQLRGDLEAQHQSGPSSGDVPHHHVLQPRLVLLDGRAGWTAASVGMADGNVVDDVGEVHDAEARRRRGLALARVEQHAQVLDDGLHDVARRRERAMPSAMRDRDRSPRLAIGVEPPRTARVPTHGRPVSGAD